MKIILIASAFALSGATAAQALDCADFIRKHGEASRGQFQCGFNQYNDAVIQQARACAGQLGEARIKSNLMAGMKRFDASEKRIGHKAACQKVLKDYPTFVRQ